jgi:hypothetical protein
MNELIEKDLKVTFPAGTKARKFDDENHGLSHCMKAVDFIVELDDRTLFIEFKDPDDPNAAKAKNPANSIEKFLSGGIDTDLQYKYRDSYLYELASGRVHKPIYYYVLIGAKTMSDAELLARTDALKRKIPVKGVKSKPWQHPLVAGCAVMNLASWNRTLPMFPASRVST